ncbi:MAG: DUF4870 domain-containing protein [Actinomycetota bacterium]|nr:DUF4870 domain-containing protein [Actinomycetota bacterium]
MISGVGPPPEAPGSFGADQGQAPGADATDPVRPPTPPAFGGPSPADVDDDAVAEQTHLGGPPPAADAPAPYQGDTGAADQQAGWQQDGWQQQAATPGWYPVDAQHQRYWDGNTWTDHVAPLAGAAAAPGAAGAASSDDRTMALLCHLGGALFSFLVPLIIYLIKKDESPFVRHHGAEALNFAITITIAVFVCIPLMFVLVGFLLLPLVIVGGWVFAIIASIAAYRDEWYRYPINIRIIS